MRICAPVTSLNENTDLGGGYFHVKNLQGLADRGVQCLIPLAFRTDYRPRANWDVRVAPIRRTFKLGALFSNVVFFFFVLWLRIVRGERFDLLRIGDLYHLGPGALLAARLCRVPTVGMIHHIDEDRPRENAVIGWTARRLDGITVPSKATAKHVARLFAVDDARLHLITEGATVFEAETLTAKAAKERMGLAGAQVVGFLGRLDPRKNVGLLLEAFAEAAKSAPRARLLIVGDGPQREILTRQAQRLGIEDKTIFAGRVDQSGKATALRAMDIFAFPSLMEGFGLAVAEAMSLGLPVVTSDRGSLPEVVAHGVTGYVVPIECAQPLTEALIELLGDANLRRKLGAAAKKHADCFYSWNACAEQTEKAYRAVLARADETSLGVLLNSGDSLATMRREGQVVRFVDNYLRRYAAAFDRVEVFSYGEDQEQPFANAVFVPGKPNWKGPVYAALMPLLHARRFRRFTLMRVMQTGAALPAVSARLLYGTPFVATYGYRYGEFMRVKGRRLYGRWLDLLDQAALRLAKNVIVTTPSLHDYVRRIVDEEKIVFLPNGVDLSAFFPGKGGKRKGKATALFVGRLTPQKNLPLAIQALAPLRDRVRLVCVGEGAEEDRLSKMAKAQGVELDLLGVVEHGKLPAIHRQADLFILPSLVEGHPKALVEAMASALPCVGTRVPGIVDVIENETNGLLVEPTAKALTEAMRRLLNEPALAKKLGEQARQTAVERYDLHRLLDKEIELLRACAKEIRRCRGC